MVINIIRVLSVLLNLYSFAILIRMIMSWFPEGDYRLGGARRFFVSITDPYLRIFRRIPFLRIGPVDFSPIVAIITLSALQITLVEWLRRGARSLILFPVFFASSVLNIISLFCLLLFVIIIVRVILLRIGVIGSFTATLDRLFNPMVLRSFQFFGIKRTMPFTIQLLLFSLAMLIIFFGLRLLSAWLFLL